MLRDTIIRKPNPDGYSLNRSAVVAYDPLSKDQYADNVPPQWFPSGKDCHEPQADGCSADSEDSDYE